MKLLVFDFDGTIADTKALYYDAIYNNLKYFGYSYKDVDKIIDKGYNLSIILKKLGLGFFVSFILKRKISKKIKERINNIKKCRDVEFIKNIKEKKIIVSNSSKEFMKPVLKHLKLNYFKEIYGSEDFIKKEDFIKNYLNKNKIKKEDCYYIGDRVVDVKVAKKIKCKSVIIIGKCSWDSRNELINANPDYLISDLKELKEIVK